MTAPLVPTTDRPYQLLPPLDSEQRHILKQSIEKCGVLEPVVFDEDGEILDGHHRVEIAEALGIDYPRRVISDLDRPGKFAYALTVNVARRHLTPSDRSGLVAQLRLRGMSIREIAKMTGVSRGTVANDLAQVSKVGHLPEQITGADGKSYAASRPAPRPDLTLDILRALATAGTGGMTAWQLAFLIDPAGPDAERAELTVRMAPVLERLARGGRASVVGEVDGGSLWALTELISETPGSVDAATTPPADPGTTPAPDAAPSTAPAGAGPTPAPAADAPVPRQEPDLEPKPTLRLVPTEDEKRAAEQRDARALLRRVVEILAPIHDPGGFVETWARHLGPYDDELADLIHRANNALAALDDLISEAGK